MNVREAFEAGRSVETNPGVLAAWADYNARTLADRVTGRDLTGYWFIFCVAAIIAYAILSPDSPMPLSAESGGFHP